MELPNSSIVFLRVLVPQTDKAKQRKHNPHLLQSVATLLLPEGGDSWLMQPLLHILCTDLPLTCELALFSRLGPIFFFHRKFTEKLKLKFTCVYSLQFKVIKFTLP